MDEVCTITASLNHIMEQLEDKSLENHRTKSQNYTAMQQYLAKDEYVDNDIFMRVLNVCVHDLKEDIKYTADTINIIITILKKIKDGAYSPDPKVLVPCAVCILVKINVTAALSDVEFLRDLCIKTIFLFPDETLVLLVLSHKAVIVELFKIHNYAQLQFEFKILLYDFLCKLLTILPIEIKLPFMTSIASVLFSKVIPSILADLSRKTIKNDVWKLLDLLENITNELVSIDYSEIPQWTSFLEGICNPKKYPLMMKSLLEKGSQVWHRLWIVFIILLKNQITCTTTNSGTPINSMLPIVETAFKLDPSNRCRAFQCWKILINNFSNETNENCINKRLKLLIIPLKLNNAKVEETAVAKFNTWWHLINKFQFKLEKFVDSTLIAFLHFCFGKHSSSGKSTFIPGQLSEHLKKRGVDALVEIIGHVNCSGCVEIDRLQGKLINTKFIANYWMDWTYSLKVGIQFSLDSIEELVPQHILCLLQSFLLSMSCLGHIQIKEDILNDLLSILSIFVQDSKHKSNCYAEAVFGLLLSFFRDELNIKDVLNVKGENNSALCKIITLTLDPCLKKYYDRSNKREMVQKLKPMTKYVLQEPVGLQFIIDNVLNNLPASDITLTFWAALAECIGESDDDLNLQNVLSVLLWPLKSINMFNDVKYPAKLWYTTYSVMHTKFGKDGFDKDVSQILHSSNIVTNSSIYLALCATLAILKCGLMTDNTNKYESNVQLLQILSNRINHYEDIEEIFPVLVDTLILVLQCFNLTNKVDLAEAIVSCVKNVLKLMMSVLKGSSDVTEISIIMQNLLKAVDLAFKSETYSKLFSILCDVTTFYSSIFQKLTLSIFENSSYQNKQLIICTEDNSDERFNTNIEPSNEALTKQNMENGKFSTPNTKEAPKKKTKKKDASIVNTVIENGEEFVVVKSNWKFNPKKLTENQKEKLQRKREDIPALYQDLSQSQDDLKLTSWKTDSQDTITTSKSSSKSTNEVKDVSLILKNLPNTEVVPKIMENILSEKEQNESEAAQNQIPESSSKTKQVTIKDCKTPRMALKDRVFRNVRNLIERSNMENVDSDMNAIQNQIENISKTPSPTKFSKDVTSLTKSAPPLSLSERPSRVKRKPKKFDDTQIYALRKRRHYEKDSQTDDEFINKNLSINVMDHTSVDDQFYVKENPSLISEKEVTIATGNMFTVNETVNLECDKSVVDATIEDTKSLHVKLIKTDIHKIISKENFTLIKTNLDPKSNQHNPPEEQELKTEFRNFSSISDLNSNEQTPTSKFYLKENYSLTSEAGIKVTTGNTFALTETGKLECDKSVIEATTGNKNSLHIKLIRNDLDTIIGKENCTIINTNRDLKCNQYNTPEAQELTTEHKSSSSINDTNSSKQRSTSKYDIHKSPIKPTRVKKSRIEKELAIDMVVGHPYLNSPSKFHKRLTRKNFASPVGTLKQKWLTDNLSHSPSKSKALPKHGKKEKSIIKESVSVTVSETENQSCLQDNIISEDNCSEDIIESSQDSTLTTITVIKKTPRKVPFVSIENIHLKPKLDHNMSSEKESYAVSIEEQEFDKTNEEISSSVVSDTNCQTVISNSLLVNQESKDDTELPQNQIISQNKSESDLTENMDTQPISDNDISDVILIDQEEKVPVTVCDYDLSNDVILIDQEEKVPVTVCDYDLSNDVIMIDKEEQIPVTVSNEEDIIGISTQEIAEAATQPINPVEFVSLEYDNNTTSEPLNNDDKKIKSTTENAIDTQNDTTQTITQSISISITDTDKADDISSPLKDDVQRKQDFMNNTIEISPIKTLSPNNNEKSPSPDNSSDYVVIKLSPPVHSNGEPVEKESPEIFTEDKISPDKRELSPTRTEINVTNTSPSSSLSLKKNRPQVRGGGRAAQMLGLCVPDKLNSLICSERIDNEDFKKNYTPNTPARRNLRILYSSTSDNNDVSIDNEDSGNFLKLNRLLPTTDSSPSGPILKRKLVEITDDATISPASKRKRVSFHDPPVSTTVSVQKYIEPLGVRSPQNSSQKRHERLLIRSQNGIKSPRRLENVFNLNSVLTKAVESFNDGDLPASNDDTQMTSLENTPAAEIVKTSELNDTEPICSDLLDCKDPIENIAAELSSATMRSLLIKELEGRIETISDLAKMTEVEVNRLCIKAPKVKVAKKALHDYFLRLPDKNSATKLDNTIAVIDIELIEDDMMIRNIETQTDKIVSNDAEMQTTAMWLTATSMQTEALSSSTASVQTHESGCKSTADIVNNCISEREDFLDQLTEQLGEPDIQKIVEKLPFSTITDSLMNIISASNASVVLSSLLKHKSIQVSSDTGQETNQLSYLRDYLCDRFSTQDLILFCSQLLQRLHDSPT